MMERKFYKMIKKELESKIQRKCQTLIKENGGFVFKTHGDMYTRPGIPDLIACIPTDIITLKKLLDEEWFKDKKIGIFVGFELKRENKLNEVSEAQKIVGREIQNAGGLWYATDDPDLVDGICKLLKGEI